MVDMVVWYEGASDTVALLAQERSVWEVANVIVRGLRREGSRIWWAPCQRNFEDRLTVRGSG